MTDYRFDIPEDLPKQLARYWLSLGIAALIGAGLLALLLGLSRTPGIQDVFPLKDFFRSALVVHVDLSVLVWFMSFAGVMWSLAGGQGFAVLGRTGFGLAATGTAIMTVSPFFPDAQPLLNNYIPVLQQPVFFGGLVVAGVGFSLTVLRALVTIKFMSPVGAGNTPSPIRFAIFLSAIAGATALGGVFFSLLHAPEVDGQAFWEAVFWGGGHTLQFQHTLLMIVAWFWLASDLGQAPKIQARTALFLFALATMPVLAAPMIFAFSEVGSAWHVVYFARLMELGHPLMLPLVVVAAAALWQVRKISAPAKSAFMASFVLFAAGGVLAYLIKGVNVVIPAHYHGSIVGVTLSFMGLAYVLLPQLGFGQINTKMARWQPYVYGAGQLMHILGLAVSGGYGVQRKVAGAEQMLITLPQKIGMGVMGMGSLVSVIGGVMFVVVCLIAMSKHEPKT